jgi:hypothetical protein
LTSTLQDLNDTHGYEASDRALRLFEQVSKAARGEVVAAGRRGVSDVGAEPHFTASFGVTDSTAAGGHHGTQPRKDRVPSFQASIKGPPVRTTS